MQKTDTDKRTITASVPLIRRYDDIMNNTVKCDACRSFLKAYSLDKSYELHQRLLKSNSTNIDIFQCATQMRRCMRFPYRYFSFAVDKKAIVTDFTNNSAYRSLFPEVGDPKMLNHNFNKQVMVFRLFLHSLVFNNPPPNSALRAEAEVDIEACVLRYQFFMHTQKQAVMEQQMGDKVLQKELWATFRTALLDSVAMYSNFIPEPNKDIQIMTKSHYITNADVHVKRVRGWVDSNANNEAILTERLFSVNTDEFDSSEDDEDADAPELELKATEMLNIMQSVLEFIMDPDDLYTQMDIEELTTAGKRTLEQRIGPYSKPIIEDIQTSPFDFTIIDTQQFKKSYQVLCEGMRSDEMSAGLNERFKIYYDVEIEDESKSKLISDAGEIQKQLHQVQFEIKIMSFHTPTFNKRRGVDDPYLGKSKAQLDAEVTKLQILRIEQKKLSEDYKLLYDQIKTNDDNFSSGVSITDEEIEFILKRPFREISSDITKSALYKNGDHIQLALKFPNGKWGNRKTNPAAQMKEYILKNSRDIYQFCYTLSGERYLSKTKKGEKTRILDNIYTTTGISLCNRLAERCFVFFELCLQRITPQLVNAIIELHSTDTKIDSMDTKVDKYKAREKRLHARIKIMGAAIQYLLKPYEDDIPLHRDKEQLSIIDLINQTILIFFRKSNLQRVAAAALWAVHPINPESIVVPSLLEAYNQWMLDIHDKELEAEKERISIKLNHAKDAIIRKYTQNGYDISAVTKAVDDSDELEQAVQVARDAIAEAEAKSEKTRMKQLDDILNTFIGKTPLPTAGMLKGMKPRLNRFKPSWFLYDYTTVDKKEVWIYFILTLKLIEYWLLTWGEDAQRYADTQDVTEEYMSQLREMYANKIEALQKKKKGPNIGLTDYDIMAIYRLQSVLLDESHTMAFDLWDISKTYSASKITSAIDIEEPLIQKLAKQLQIRIPPINPFYVANNSINNDAMLTFRYTLFHFAYKINQNTTQKHNEPNNDWLDQLLNISDDNYRIAVQDWLWKAATVIKTLFTQVILDFYNNTDLSHSNLLFEFISVNPSEFNSNITQEVFLALFGNIMNILIPENNTDDLRKLVKRTTVLKSDLPKNETKEYLKNVHEQIIAYLQDLSQKESTLKHEMNKSLAAIIHTHTQTDGTKDVIHDASDLVYNTIAPEIIWVMFEATQIHTTESELSDADNDAGDADVMSAYAGLHHINEPETADVAGELSDADASDVVPELDYDIHSLMPYDPNYGGGADYRGDASKYDFKN